MAIHIGVFLVGVVVGIAELTSRHTDHRLLAICTFPSIVYLALNGMLSVAAMMIINYIRPDWLGYRAGDITAKPNTFLVVMTAGFGAAAFFRSSIFKLKTKDGDLNVGPALVIDVFLEVIDEAVDRDIGEKRIEEVCDLMVSVDFTRASINLPVLCFESLKRLSPESQKQFAFQLKALNDATNINEKVRCASLGLAITALTGKKILTKAIEQLGDSVTSPK